MDVSKSFLFEITLPMPGEGTGISLTGSTVLSA
jgi:hypothetical protein